MAEDFCGRVLGGQFTIGEKIGEGGYGWVYEARQASPDRIVAVKILRDRAADPTRARVSEAQALAHAHHPNAVGVIASGIEPDDGLMWIAMQLVDGTSLRAWFQSFGKMPLHDVVSLVEQAAGALHTAHRRGIVHRDLKPENIMITPDEQGRLVATLLDFGIAKSKHDKARRDRAETKDDDEPGAVRDSAVTSRGVVSTSRTTRRRLRVLATPATAPSDGPIGTTEYCPPEMARDPKSAGPAADVYALGLIAYEALAGRKPFQGKTREEWRNAHELAPLEPIGGSTPAVFDALLRALAKRPEDRPSPLEFARELRAALVADPAEQIKTSARLWEARGRSPGLLWGPSALAAVERRQPLAQDDVIAGAFLAASRRRAQAGRWKGVAAVLVVALVGAAYRSYKNGETSEALVTQAEADQGGQFLLRGDAGRATEHLAEAYRRGDRSWSTKFMYARSVEPQQAELARFQALKGRMWAVTSSPDGRQIATTDQGGVQVWDARTFGRLYTLPHTDVVYDAVYTADSAQLITACGDGAVRIWDAPMGKPVRALRADGPPRRWRKISVSGEAVAAMDFYGRSVIVWNILSGATLTESHGADSHDQSGGLSLAFSADGRWLAASVGEEARIFDTSTWQRAVSIPGVVGSLAWDPTGARIVTGSLSGDVSIWDVSGNRMRRLRENGPAAEIVVFSSDGRLVVTADRDGTERIWNVATGEPLVLSMRARRVRSIAFDATSTLVALAAADGLVSVFDARNALPLATYEGAQDAVWSLRFDAASHLLAASWDGSARVWSARSPYRQWSSISRTDHCDLYGTAAPDARYVIVGCQEHTTQVWDTAQDRFLAELPAMPSKMARDFAPTLPVVSADGSRAAIARGRAAELYELPGGRLLRSIPHGAEVTALAFGPTDELVSGAADGTLQLTPEGKPPVALPAASEGIDAVAQLADGRVLAADAAKRLRVVGPTGAGAAELPTRVTLLRPSPDGGQVVAIQDNTIPSFSGRGDPPILVDLRGHRISMLSGHRGRVFNARWVGGDRFLTTASDGVVRLWDGSGHQVRVYQAQDRHFLADAALSADGSLLVAGGADGLVEFWDAATGRELWALRTHASHVVGLHFDGADLVTRGFGGEMARWRFAPAADVIRRMVSR